MEREVLPISNNTQMKKELGVSAAMAIVVGCVIGAGVFFKPYAIYGATGGAPGMGYAGLDLRRHCFPAGRSDLC